MKKSVFILLLIILLQPVSGQLIPAPDLPGNLINKNWAAYWVKMASANDTGYGNYLYRNKIFLSSAVEQFIIHISADNRYKLYINNQFIGLGPAKSDIDHWVFDTYNIAPFLNSGENIIAVRVWNYSIDKPVSFISSGIRFLCQGNGPEESALNTPGRWKIAKDHSINVEPLDPNIRSYFVVPPGDEFNCALHPWGWASAAFDDSEWSSPAKITRACPRGTNRHGIIDHALVPRLIPAMKYEKADDPQIRLVNGKIDSLTGKPVKDIRIPPNSKETVLLDQKVLINSYPLIKFSKGENSKIKITYSEALYDRNDQKGNRDDVSGKKMVGYSDVILPDGKPNRDFSPLWFRTFRYVQLDIETDADSLIIHSIENYETGYPFKETGFFKSSNTELDRIWETGWRTSLLCAGETYYDCPYYEQLQYVGDTRIQALLSLYVSGDDRLMRKAIVDFYNSILPEGLTQSRYPSQPEQVIPTYSLLWISMINDYLWHRPDYEFVFEFLVPIQNIISWFEKRIDQETGMLGPIEFWPFIDWTDEWSQTSGAPPDAYTGNSSIITLLFAMSLDQASEIFNFYGYGDIGKSYVQLADEMINATSNLCWDENKGIMADSPLKNSYSQHANALAVLTDAIPEDMQALVIDRISQSDDYILASFYFKFYLHRALIKAGLANKYLDQLDPWFRMIDSGLTTFAEKPDPSRSDCHAWSASPLIEFLNTIAGIKPGSYGFESVIIDPHPGNLDWIKASVPHYMGNIELDLVFNKINGVKGTITLPDNLSGVLIWDGSVTNLKPGRQKVVARSIRDKYKIK